MFKNRLFVIFLTVLALGWLVPSIAMAEMSEQELRLQALEERQQGNAALLDVLKRFTWYGDLRNRYQAEETETSTSSAPRDRFRLRFRFGGKVHMSKDLDVIFRLDTPGVGSVDSGNATLDGTFGSKGIDLGVAHFNYTPTIFGMDTTVMGGKFKPPFMKSEIIWDSDVTSEGLAEHITLLNNGKTTIDAIFGQLVLEENNPGRDLYLMAYQGVLTQKTGMGKFKFAVGYYDVVNHEENTALTAVGTNSSVSTGSEVKMLDFMGEWSNKIMGHKLKIFGEYEKNVGALLAGNSDLDTAWQLGAKYGKSGKKFGDWDLKVLYRVVQSEAVLDTISDSDFHGSRSNARGWETGGGIGLRKGVKLAVTYFDTQEERGTKRENWTLQTDLKFKF